MLVDVVPFRPPRKPRDVTAYIGMVIFLGGWAMMFAGLFFAYALVRSKAMSWPPPGESRLPIGLPAFNTLLLVGSSASLWLGMRAIRNAKPRALGLWLTVAFVLAALFCGLQFVVWQKLYVGGLTPSSGIYGSVFYALTCFHALHVLAGMIGLLTLFPRAWRGRFTLNDYAPVRVWSMYWHFVDVIWVLMFVTVYVI
jgi:heme/copper-type cytochrome/quinol oxidase subunit 3